MNLQFTDNRLFPALAITGFILCSAFNFLYLPLETRFSDEKRFAAEALDLERTGEFRMKDARAYEMPLTAIINAFSYRLTGNMKGMIALTRLFQSFLLITQAFLIGRISFMIFGNRLSSLLSAAVVLFYPFFVFYQGLLLSETIFNTFLTGSFFCLYLWYKDGFDFDRNFFLANLLFALSIYTKATLSFLPPFLTAFFALVNTGSLKTSLKFFAVSAALYSLLLSPWWIRNHIIFGQFIPFTTVSSSFSFYLGNNPANKEGGCDIAGDISPARLAELEGIKDEIGKMNAYNNAAKDFIRNNPERFLELMWMKLKRFWNIIPNAEGFSKGLFKWVSILTFGPVIFMAVISVLLHLKNWRKLSPIYVLVLYFTLVHSVVISSLRYRLPLEPFLIILAVQSTATVTDMALSRIHGRL